MPEKRAPRKRAAKPRRKLSDEAQHRIAKVIQAWGDAAADPSAANLRRLAAESGALENIFRQVRERAERATSLLLLQRDAPQAPPPAAAEEGEVRPEAFGKEEEEEVTPPDMQLDAFFQTVSGAVVKAQQQLDMQSIAYAQQVKDSPVPPALYSIPNVKAEVKLGFSIQDGSNLWVRLFGKPEDKSTYSESTVSFDIVAAPPPPGGPGTYSSPIPSFLVVGPERERVAAVVAGIRALIAQQTNVQLAADPAVWLPFTAVFRAGAEALPQADRAGYTVIVRGDSIDKPLIVVRLVLASPDKAVAFAPADRKAKVALFDLAATVRSWEQSVTLPAPKP